MSMKHNSIEHHVKFYGTAALHIGVIQRRCRLLIYQEDGTKRFKLNLGSTNFGLGLSIYCGSNNFPEELKTTRQRECVSQLHSAIDLDSSCYVEYRTYGMCHSFTFDLRSSTYQNSNKEDVLLGTPDYLQGFANKVHVPEILEFYAYIPVMDSQSSYLMCNPLEVAGRYTIRESVDVNEETSNRISMGLDLSKPTNSRFGFRGEVLAVFVWLSMGTGQLIFPSSCAWKTRSGLTSSYVEFNNRIQGVKLYEALYNSWHWQRFQNTDVAERFLEKYNKDAAFQNVIDFILSVLSIGHAGFRTSAWISGFPQSIESLLTILCRQEGVGIPQNYESKLKLLSSKLTGRIGTKRIKKLMQAFRNLISHELGHELSTAEQELLYRFSFDAVIELLNKVVPTKASNIVRSSSDMEKVDELCKRVLNSSRLRIMEERARRPRG